MRFLIDILGGLIGMMVWCLIWEWGKNWARSEWAALTTRKSFAEVMRELTKNVKRPKPPEPIPFNLAEHNAKWDEVVELVARARRKRPVVLQPAKRYSVQEILAMARAEKRPDPVRKFDLPEPGFINEWII